MRDRRNFLVFTCLVFLFSAERNAAEAKCHCLVVMLAPYVSHCTAAGTSTTSKSMLNLPLTMPAAVQCETYGANITTRQWPLKNPKKQINKICVVDGRGGFQKSSKHCPNLETPGSEVECISGTDRFDCLRKIRKGKADFSIFTPEDLVAATNTYNDILITNEMRTSEKEKYEEQLVAIVSESSGIETTYDLKDKVLCHSGYTDDGIISTVLNDFLETTVVRPQSCEPSLTVPENRILSTSKFFKAACKPGVWVNDKELDNELKRKYKNLCQACSDPSSCSTDDQYYGKSGALLCLRDGAGDVAWTTLNTAISQFELNENSSKSNGYKFLCPDDTTRPLKSTPCLWVAKPWAVVGASSASSSAVQKIIANVSHDGLPWQRALMDLLEVVSYHIELNSLPVAEPVESYLLKIPGFLSANSFTGCHPPRTVKICTTSIISKYKCDWMREAAEVRGVAPDIDCLKADNVTHCMRAIQMNVADVVMVEPDYINVGKKYGLSTLFYETVQDEDKDKIVAVVKSNSNIRTFKDLMGKKACFSMYNGMAWNSVVNRLQGEFSTCPYERAMHDYFGDSCVPNVPEEYQGKLAKLCEMKYSGYFGALDCMVEKNADVAFVTTKMLRSYTNQSSNTMRMSDFRIICEKQPCHLSWSPVGQAMVYQNLTTWRQKDILDVFLELDALFGKNYKEPTRVFTMYGSFNGEANVLFHDSTKELRKVPVLKNFDVMPQRYEDVLKNIKQCQEVASKSSALTPPVVLFLIALLVLSR